MKRIVGLVVLTHSKANGLKVILQRRGTKDIFPGSCKISAQGEMEKNDDPISAVTRISKDELGEELTLKWKLNSTLERVFNFVEKNQKTEISVYGVLVPEDVLELVRIKGTSGGIEHADAKRFFTSDGIIHIMPYNKVSTRTFFGPYEVVMKHNEIGFVSDTIKALSSKCF